MIHELLERLDFEPLDNPDYLVYKRKTSNETIILPKEKSLTSKNISTVKEKLLELEIVDKKKLKELFAEIALNQKDVSRLDVHHVLNLTNEQKETLKQLWTPAKYDIIVRDEDENLVGIVNGNIDMDGEVSVLWDTLYEAHFYQIDTLKRSYKCLPLLSISDMISLLKVNGVSLEYNQTTLDSNLVEILWEKVKEIL